MSIICKVVFSLLNRKRYQTTVAVLTIQWICAGFCYLWLFIAIEDSVIKREGCDHINQICYGGPSKHHWYSCKVLFQLSELFLSKDLYVLRYKSLFRGKHFWYTGINKSAHIGHVFCLIKTKWGLIENLLNSIPIKFVSNW